LTLIWKIFYFKGEVKKEDTKEIDNVLAVENLSDEEVGVRILEQPIEIESNHNLKVVHEGVIKENGSLVKIFCSKGNLTIEIMDYRNEPSVISFINITIIKDSTIYRKFSVSEGDPMLRSIPLKLDEGHYKDGPILVTTIRITKSNAEASNSGIIEDIKSFLKELKNKKGVEIINHLYDIVIDIVFKYLKKQLYKYLN